MLQILGLVAAVAIAAGSKVEPGLVCTQGEGTCSSAGTEESALLQAARMQTPDSHVSNRRESESCDDSSPVICPTIHQMGFCDISEEVREECKHSCRACGTSPTHPPNP